ncbi:hypothetical protein [Cupriavidus basilensis]|uniref:hypothetical protein n=1 Tax=Cupriavidus basilensis TaxID=68895 RepID=UPI0020A6CDAD|nr:hypothetical protein [Cupriavidus basilensis]MCP3021691.1 hypothetical protein [Cupriavidus basilensis]MDR3452553.1 hypothetical protein [Rhodoferax sp.]
MADMDPQGIRSPEPDNKPTAGSDSQPPPRWIPPPRTVEQRMVTTVRQRWPQFNTDWGGYVWARKLAT